MRNHCCKWSSKFPENSRTLIWVAHQIIQIQAECVILPPSTHFTPNSWDLTQPTPWLWYIKLSSPDSLCNQLLCDGKAQTFIQRADAMRKDSNRPFGWSEVVFFPRLRDFPSASLFSKKPRYPAIQTSSPPTQIEVHCWKVSLPHVNFFRVFGMAISGPEGFWKVSCRTSTAANDQHTLAWKSTTNMDETSR